jgi:hypothetical protein
MVSSDRQSIQKWVSIVQTSIFAVTAVLIAPVLAAQAAPEAKLETMATIEVASASVQEFIERQNQLSRAAGEPSAIERIEVMLSPAAAARAGIPETVFYAKTHTMRLASRWVQGDPRRQGRRAISYGNWEPGMWTLGLDHQYFYVEPGLDGAAATWNNVLCSNARLVKTSLPPLTIPSRYLRFRGYANVPQLVDIGIVGWLPGSIFEKLFGPIGRLYVGITIYDAYVDPLTGQFTDIDGDQRPDQANAEIWFQEGGYYDVLWTLQANDDFYQLGMDVQTIALHELGHALDLDHMGAVFTDPRGVVHESPIAIMNPLAVRSKRVPFGTDAAALCSNFATWTLP